MVKRGLRGEYELVLRERFRGTILSPLQSEREHVYATENHHVVGTSSNSIHAAEGTAAFALAHKNTRDVSSAITHQRRAFLAQRGEYHFSPFTIRNRLKGFRIKDLDDELVLANMKAVLLFAPRRQHQGPLLQKVRKYRKTECPFFARSQRALPLSTVPHLKYQHGLGIRECHSLLLLRPLRYSRHKRAYSIGQSTSEVLHETNLTFSVTSRHRKNGAASSLSPIVGAKATGKQTITIGDL